MDVFDLVFTLMMVMFPAVFTLFVRKRTTPAGQDDTPGTGLAALTQRLWLWTAVAVISYLVLYGWRAREVAYYMWFAFFPLWFILAMPVLRAKNPGWGPTSRSPVRSARLERRDVLPKQLRFGWFALAALWVLLLAVAVLGLVLTASEPPHWWLLGFSLMAGGELWLMHWATRRSLIEPEPVPQNETTEIREARASLRNLKMVGWLAAAAVTMLIFAIPPALLIWMGNDALTVAIVIGAGGGVAAGIGGAVFGVLADLRRAKINRLCLESPRKE